MARLARVVVPNAPHHIPQRGNRRLKTFFDDADYELYLELMAESCAHENVTCLAYCLMPNHVHLVLTPPSQDALTRAIANAHRRYTRHINFAKGWTGYLWQGRFGSFPMDEPHLLSAVRYVEQNPVRARLVRRAQDWRWSSARAHLARADDRLVRVRMMLDLVPEWRAYLADGLDRPAINEIERHLSTGRPLGGDAFLARIEKKLKRALRPQKRGPKPKRSGN